MVFGHVLPELILPIEPLVTEPACTLAQHNRLPDDYQHISKDNAADEAVEETHRACTQGAQTKCIVAALAVAMSSEATLGQRAFTISMLLVTVQLLLAVQDLFRQKHLQADMQQSAI